jgi:hypothetical protein
MLCVSLGFHWGLLQSVAWAGMIVNYSLEGSLNTAVCKTFDGRHPCPLCKLIRAGKTSESKPAAQQSVNKVDLFAGGGAAFDFPTTQTTGFPILFPTLNRTDAPPLPPPRPFFG